MPLTLTDLGHGYRAERPLFAAIDAVMREGMSYAVVGPSGSGKSTLLGILAGDVAPAEGKVVRAPGTTVSWVFQNPHGVPRRTAIDHVVVPYLAKGIDRRTAEAEAAALLEDFGLTGIRDTQFRHLSGGEAQRLMLARAIACEPTLLLVDEPTAQLDMATSSLVNASLQRLRGDGRIVVIATHDPGTRGSCTDVLDLADYQR